MRERQIPSWIASCEPDDDVGPAEGVDFDRAGAVGVYAGFRRIGSIAEAYRRFDALPPRRQADHMAEWKSGMQYFQRARGML